MNQDIHTRVDVSKYLLAQSYSLISHYDSKTNQQLTIIGFDFAIISMLITAIFATNCIGNVTRGFIIFFSIISYVLLIISLVYIRKALVPHVQHHNKMKAKLGMIYFMDIKAGYTSEEGYVQMLVGEDKELQSSRYYQEGDEYAFEKCFIEDCARDIYAHAVILGNKTAYVHKAFNWVFATTASCISTVAIASLLWIFSL